MAAEYCDVCESKGKAKHKGEVPRGWYGKWDGDRTLKACSEECFAHILEIVRERLAEDSEVIITHPLEKFERWRSVRKGERAKVTKFLKKQRDKYEPDDSVYRVLHRTRRLLKADRDSVIDEWKEWKRLDYEQRRWVMLLICKWAKKTGRWQKGITDPTKCAGDAAWEAYIHLHNCLVRAIPHRMDQCPIWGCINMYWSPLCCYHNEGVPRAWKEWYGRKPRVKRLRTLVEACWPGERLRLDSDLRRAQNKPYAR